MEIQNKEGGIVEIDGRVRIEPGPRVLTAVATLELLDDAVTARHYRPPFKRIATAGDLAVTIVRDGDSYVVGDGSGDELRDTRGNLIEVTQYTVDALGTPIVLGETITYVDWRSKWRNGGPGAVWNVYSLEDPDGPAGELLPVWRKKGTFDTPALAMSAATTIAVELAGTPAPKDPTPPRRSRK